MAAPFALFQNVEARATSNTVVDCRNKCLQRKLCLRENSAKKSFNFSCSNTGNICNADTEFRFAQIKREAVIFCDLN